MDSTINEHKASIIRKYPIETLVIMLAFAVSVLTFGVIQNNNKIEALHNEFNQYVKDDNKVLIETLDKTNATMEKTNMIIEKFQPKR